jgi:hypothetical protein
VQSSQAKKLCDRHFVEFLQNSPPESPATPTYLKKEKSDSLPRRSNSMSSQRRSMYGDLDDASPDLSSFRPVTLTVKSFFKQVKLLN